MKWIVGYAEIDCLGLAVPSFNPLRVFIVLCTCQVFKSDKDSLLGLYGAFGYDLTFQFEATTLKKDRPAHQRDLVLFIPDEILVWDPAMTTAHRYSYDFAVEGVTTVGKPRDGPELIFNFDNDVSAYEDHAPGQYADKVRQADKT